MATILDLGLLEGFVDIFVWVLVFLIVYGSLEVTNLLKNKGLHALFAFTITAVIVLTGGGTNIITAIAPWAVVIAALIFFLMMLGQFAGLKPDEVMQPLGGKGIVWYVTIPLFVILVVAWTAGPDARFVTDPDTGEQVELPQDDQRAYLGILTDPKVLGLILIFAVSFITIMLMTGGGGAAS
jgi:hypothetical protein